MNVPPPRAQRARLSLYLIAAMVPWSACAIAAAQEKSDTIAWRNEYGLALQEARAKNQLLWIQFTAPWCPNCTRMEQDSFPNPAIRAHASRSFVPVKLRSDLNQELALSFELSGLPATVILAPSREVVVLRQGYLGPDELGLLLDQALSQHARNGTITSARGEANKAKPVARPAAKAKNESQLALSGYCPVSLVSDKRLVPGQTEYTVSHEGRLYRFASLVTINLFRRDPDRYVPVNSGNCPVASIDRDSTELGDPRFGVLFQGRLFLCATDADRRQFLKDPARYAAVDVIADGFCPHCLAESGMFVRGNPRVELNHQGRRYWFPDPAHREAFLAASEPSSARR